MATVMVEVAEAKGFRFRSGFERPQADKPPKPIKSEKTRPVVEPPPPRGFAWAETKKDAIKRVPEPVMSEESDDTEEEAPAVDDAIQVERYQFTMYQERRPPLTGCWLVKSILPVTQHQLFGADTD